MSNKNTYDFAIIGAGIVGLSTALHLQRQNKSVLVLEKEKNLVFINLAGIQELFIPEFITSQILPNQNFQ